MKENNVGIGEVERERDQEKKGEMYNKYVKGVTPTHNVIRNMINAFLFGGTVCLIGEGFTNLYKWFGGSEDTAGAYTTLTLVFLSVVLTGTGIYSKLAKYAGAGLIVPITGFANSVASPAIEYKKEGQVFGIGCKIFTIAGPVILYGVFSSWLLGLIYFILMKIGII